MRLSCHIIPTSIQPPTPNPTPTHRYETAHHSKPLAWVPMTKPTGWYTVTLHDIKIGATSIAVDPSAVRAYVGDVLCVWRGGWMDGGMCGGRVDGWMEGWVWVYIFISSITHQPTNTHKNSSTPGRAPSWTRAPPTRISRAPSRWPSRRRLRRWVSWLVSGVIRWLMGWTNVCGRIDWCV